MMKWKYYNHAVIPTTAPHEDADMEFLKNGLTWKIKGGGVFRSWPDGPRILTAAMKRNGGM